MTWARIVGDPNAVPPVVATGSGRTAFRLRIEGLVYEFVTDSAMEAGSGGFVRRVGLRRDGLVIEEQADLAHATLEMGTMSASIVDVGGNATAAFGRFPSHQTTLRTDADADDTTINVHSIDGWAADDVVHIDTEAIVIGAVSSVDGVHRFTGCTRGYLGTTAQAHYTGGVAGLRTPLVTDWPLVLEGRRATLYAYGDGDSLLGDGTQIWIGVVATEPRLQDATTWQLTLDPITKILDQPLGYSQDMPGSPRGIHYSAGCRLTIGLTELLTATTGGGYANGATIEIGGGATSAFYETQDEFVSALNVELEAETTGWSGTVVAVADGEDGWHLEVRTGATPRWIGVEARSALDGETSPWADVRDSSDELEGMVSAGLPYRVEWSGGPPGARTVPRGCIGVSSNAYLTGGAWQQDISRIHWGGDADATQLSHVSVEWADGETVAYGVSGAVETPPDRYFTLVGATRHRVFTADSLPKISATTIFVENGSIADLVLDITANAATRANKGAGPFITTADMDTATWTSVIDEAIAAMTANAGVLSHRLYGLSDQVPFLDILTEELKLYGCYLATDVSGKLIPKRLELLAPTSSAVAEIDASTTIMSGGMPTIEKNPLSMINVVRLQTSYDFRTGEWTGSPVNAISSTAFGAAKGNARILEIKPYSAGYAFIGLLPVDYATAQAIAEKVLGIFGSPHQVATVDVPLSLFAVRVGDTVTFTSAQLPGVDGTRGFTSRQALVIGRRWPLGEASGTLTLFLHGQSVAGYSPSARVASQSGSGVSWTLTIDTTKYFATGDDCTDHYATGDRVQIVKWDAIALGAILGTVGVVTATTIAVTFASTWTPGADTWDLIFADATDGALTAAQKIYGYVADDERRIQFAATTHARTFA